MPNNTKILPYGANRARVQMILISFFLFLSSFATLNRSILDDLYCKVVQFVTCQIFPCPFDEVIYYFQNRNRNETNRLREKDEANNSNMNETLSYRVLYFFIEMDFICNNEMPLCRINLWMWYEDGKIKWMASTFIALILINVHAQQTNQNDRSIVWIFVFVSHTIRIEYFIVMFRFTHHNHSVQPLTNCVCRSRVMTFPCPCPPTLNFYFQMNWKPNIFQTHTMPSQKNPIQLLFEERMNLLPSVLFPFKMHANKCGFYFSIWTRQNGHFFINGCQSFTWLLRNSVHCMEDLNCGRFFESRHNMARIIGTVPRISTKIQPMPNRWVTSSFWPDQLANRNIWKMKHQWLLFSFHFQFKIISAFRSFVSFLWNLDKIDQRSTQFTEMWYHIFVHFISIQYHERKESTMETVWTVVIRMNANHLY